MNFLKDFDDNLDLTVDLDEILALSDKENKNVKSNKIKKVPELFDEEFNDFVCGIPEKSIITSHTDSFFENNSSGSDGNGTNIELGKKNCSHKFLTNLHAKLLTMIQKEMKLQEEIKKYLTIE